MKAEVLEMPPLVTAVYWLFIALILLRAMDVLAGWVLFGLRAYQRSRRSAALAARNEKGDPLCNA